MRIELNRILLSLSTAEYESIDDDDTEDEETVGSTLPHHQTCQQVPTKKLHPSCIKWNGLHGWLIQQLLVLGCVRSFLSCVGLCKLYLLRGNIRTTEPPPFCFDTIERGDYI